MRRRLVAVAVPILVGIVAGLLWVALTDRWYWTVTNGRLTMGEAAAIGQFRAVAMFVAIGVGVCAVWGAMVGATSRASWRLVPFLIAGALVAAVVAWQVGLLVGPQDPSSHAERLSEGDKVAAQFVVDSVAPFLLWPVGALGGLLAATVLAAGAQRSRQARGSNAEGTRR
jgi:hypothetical protein